MKTKNYKKQSSQYQRSIHQQIEYTSRHRSVLTLAMMLMLLGLISFDSRVRDLLSSTYAESFAWVGMHMNHEHPAHSHNTVATARIPTIGGPG